MSALSIPYCTELPYCTVQFSWMTSIQPVTHGRCFSFFVTFSCSTVLLHAEPYQEMARLLWGNLSREPIPTAPKKVVDAGMLKRLLLSQYSMYGACAIFIDTFHLYTVLLCTNIVEIPKADCTVDHNLFYSVLCIYRVESPYSPVCMYVYTYVQCKFSRSLGRWEIKITLGRSMYILNKPHSYSSHPRMNYSAVLCMHFNLSQLHL